MHNVLVTGGLGFIGSHLVDSFSKKNHDIMILTKTLSKKSNAKTFSPDEILNRLSQFEKNINNVNTSLLIYYSQN